MVLRRGCIFLRSRTCPSPAGPSCRAAPWAGLPTVAHACRTRKYRHLLRLLEINSAGETVQVVARGGWGGDIAVRVGPGYALRCAAKSTHGAGAAAG